MILCGLWLPGDSLVTEHRCIDRDIRILEQSTNSDRAGGFYGVDGFLSGFMKAGQGLRVLRAIS
jgi:hypothetical protein